MGGPFCFFVPNYRAAGVAVEDPLGGVIGIGFWKTMGVFFSSYFFPVIEVEGDFDKCCWGYIQFLVYFSYFDLKAIGQTESK